MRFRPRPIGTRTALALSAILLAARPHSAAAQFHPDREVVGLEFDGNSTFDDAQLEAAIITERTHCKTFLFTFPFPLCPFTNWGFAHHRAFLEEDELPLDVLRLKLFYRQRGYRDARVDTLVRRSDGEVRVRFLIDEGKPTLLSSVAIRGLEGILDTAVVRRSFPLREGDPFDLVVLTAGEAGIVNRLRRRGYMDAAVLRDYFIPAGERVVELTLEVQPGARLRVGAITIKGAETTGEPVVRRFLSFKPGQVFDREKLLDSQRSLYELDALRYANITAVRRAPDDTLMDVNVEVAPAPTRTIRTGIGLSTTECAQAEVRFTHRNFFGGARRLQLTGRLSNILANQLETRFPCTDVGQAPVFQDLNFRLLAEFRQPYFLSGRNSLKASAFLERETVPDLFVRESRGGEIAVIRRLRSRMTFGLAFQPEFTNFGKQSADVFFCVNFGFCQPADIDLLTEARWLNPLVLSWRYDRTNNPFSPSAGYRTAVEFESANAATGSDYRYVRFTVQANNFERITPGIVFAAHLKTGLVEATGGNVFGVGVGATNEVIHPRKRFFGGGPQSVRGFGLNLLGPTVLAVDAARRCPGVELETCVAQLEPSQFEERPQGGDAAAEASLELRFRLADRWSAVGFVDVGQVWPDITRLRAPVATPGLGLRYFSPVGPLRLDVGYNPSGPKRRSVVAVLPDGEIRELQAKVLFDPFTFDRPSGLHELLRRLQLQLSIGEAF